MIRVIKIYKQQVHLNTKTGEGLKELLDIIEPKISGLIAKYWIDGQESQDKRQNLNIKVWESISKYNAKKSSFPTFIYRCLDNFIKDELKHQSIRQKQIQFESLTKNIDIPDVDNTQEIE